jgi:hypothetical protein
MKNNCNIIPIMESYNGKVASTKQTKYTFQKQKSQVTVVNFTMKKIASFTTILNVFLPSSVGDIKLYPRIFLFTIWHI